MGACGRRLDIDNDRVLNVDKLVEPIAELHTLFGFHRPCRRRIGRRDRLRLFAVGLCGRLPVRTAVAAVSIALDLRLERLRHDPAMRWIGGGKGP